MVDGDDPKGAPELQEKDINMFDFKCDHENIESYTRKFLKTV